MTWPVSTSVDYERDVNAVLDWLAPRFPERMTEFLDALDAVRRELEANPRLHRARRGAWRMVAVPGFDYGLWYFVRDTPPGVYVAGVLHHHRNPAIIAKRTHTRNP